MNYKSIIKIILVIVIISSLLLTYKCSRKPEKSTVPQAEQVTTQKKTIVKQKTTFPPTPPIKSTTKRITPTIKRPIAQNKPTAVRNVTRPVKHTTNGTSHTELLAMLKNIESIEDPFQKNLAFKELGKDIGIENFSNALVLARTISDANIRRLIYKGVFEAQTELDPLEALKMAATLASQTVSKNDYTTAIIIAIRGAAAVDPHTALSYLDGIKDRRTKTRATAAIYNGWGKLDQNAALEAAAQLSENEQKRIVPAIFNGWAQRDMLGAINYANDLGDVAIKRTILYNIANGFLEDQWEVYAFASTIENEIPKMPELIQSHVLTTLYNRWSTTSPSDAADHYATHFKDQLDTRNNTLLGIMRTWAKTSPKDALEWAENSLESDEAYVNVVRTITGTLRHKDPKQVAALLEEMPFSFTDDTAGSIEVYNLMTSWARKNPQDAIDWAESLDNNNRQLKIIATKSIAANMVMKDYQGSMDWADSLQDSDMQAYAFSNIALKQSLKNMAKSDEWIETLPTGFVKTRTVAGYALGALWRSRDTTAAAKFKQQLSNDELNPAELINILQNSNLDENKKSRMIELMEQ